MGWINAHGDFMLFGFFVYSAFVSGMPEPAPTDGKAYNWAYHSLHILSGDLSSVIGSRVPKA